MFALVNERSIRVTARSLSRLTQETLNKTALTPKNKFQTVILQRRPHWKSPEP